MPKWVAPLLIWGVLLSIYFVRFLPIPENYAKTWMLVVISVLGVFILIVVIGAFVSEVGLAGVIGIAAVTGIVVVISQVYEHAGGWFIALIAIVIGFAYLHRKMESSGNESLGSEIRSSNDEISYESKARAMPNSDNARSGDD